jgi:2-keto-4-pentenoate hydratase
VALPFDPQAAAQRIVSARKGAGRVPHALVLPPDLGAAHAVQDATLAALGPIGGWKVGAKGPSAEPGCAPLPASGLMASGAHLIGPPWTMRGIELEVGLRLGRDLIVESPDTDKATLQLAVDAVLPVIEVVETRLADWRESDPLAQVADLQTHGALVVGTPSTLSPADLDLRNVQAYLAFDRQPVASTRGANPAGDVWRLLGWLAWHAAQRGHPLRAGQIVTTGSCTGLLFAAEGANVQGHLEGIGLVELQF